MMTFTISDKEQEAIEKWQRKHKRKCSLRKDGENTHYTYSFTPTGIGDIICVRCSCGKSIDVTDIDSW